MITDPFATIREALAYLDFLAIYKLGRVEMAHMERARVKSEAAKEALVALEVQVGSPLGAATEPGRVEP